MLTSQKFSRPTSPNRAYLVRANAFTKIPLRETSDTLRTLNKSLKCMTEARQ
jgi:hypothetical protein